MRECWVVRWLPDAGVCVAPTGGVCPAAGLCRTAAGGVGRTAGVGGRSVGAIHAAAPATDVRLADGAAFTPGIPSPVN